MRYTSELHVLVVATILAVNDVTALREIRRFQKSQDLIIPKMNFARLVREITMEMDGGRVYKFQSLAIEAI